MSIFVVTFATENSEENMSKYLKESFSLSKLTYEIQDKNAAFYFAKLNNNIIGYLKLNQGRPQTELPKDNALEMERIYVLREFQIKQVGQKIFDKELKIARQKNISYIWLGVWEKNLNAIQFYIKNGIVEFDKHIFKLGDDEQTDILMKLKLSN